MVIDDISSNQQYVFGISNNVWNASEKEILYIKKNKR